METIQTLQQQLADARSALADLNSGRMIRAVQTDDVRREFIAPTASDLERQIASLEAQIGRLQGRRRRAISVVLP